MILVRMLIYRVVRFRVKSRNMCLAKLILKNAGKIKLFNVVKTENNRKRYTEYRLRDSQVHLKKGHATPRAIAARRVYLGSPHSFR